METTTVDKCAVCGAFDFNYQDEVSGTVFCAEHAGPLAWSVHDVDQYSLALRIHGHYDTSCPLPSETARQHSSSAGDASPLPSQARAA